jgi:hypothetical protein
VRPRHPSWKAFGLDGASSSSGPGPRRFSSPARYVVRSRLARFGCRLICPVCPFLACSQRGGRSQRATAICAGAPQAADGDCLDQPRNPACRTAAQRDQTQWREQQCRRALTRGQSDCCAEQPEADRAAREMGRERGAGGDAAVVVEGAHLRRLSVAAVRHLQHPYVAGVEPLRRLLLWCLRNRQRLHGGPPRPGRRVARAGPRVRDAGATSSRRG